MSKIISGDVAIGRHVYTGGDANIAGSATIKGNVKVDGWLDAKNIKYANKGLFPTPDKLKEAYPEPKRGWYALVGETIPAPIYIVVDGEWVNSGNISNDLNVDLTDYVSKAELEGKEYVTAPDLEDKDYATKTELSDASSLYEVADPSEGYHTDITARLAVPQRIRKEGLLISYRIAAGCNVLERFIGSGTLSLESVWGNKHNWQRITNAYLNVNDFNPGIVYETFSNGIAWIPDANKHTGVVVTVPLSDGTWDTRQFIGDASTEWGYTDSKWISLITIRKSVNVIVAAYDSTVEEKANADIVAMSLTQGWSVIRQAINRLETKGGIVQLMSGTYSSDTMGDLIYMTTKPVILQGVGWKSTKIVSEIATEYTIQMGVQGCAIKDLSLAAGILDTSGNSEPYLENVQIGETMFNSSVQQKDVAKVIAVKPSAGIKGIQTAMNKLPDGGKIMLEAGRYESVAGEGLNLSVANITIEGQGKATIISRTGSTNDVFVQDGYAEVVKNVVLKDLAIEHGGTFVTPCYTEKPVKLINCWVGGKYCHQNQETCNNIITVGKGMDFETVFKAYESISSMTPLPSKTNRYEIHVYGHVKEEAGKRLYLNKQYVDIIGHNATIEYGDDNAVGESAYSCATIVDNAVTSPSLSENYGEYNHSTYKDLHFLRTGTVNAWNFPCVDLKSDYVTLINCTFENKTKSGVDFDPSITPEGSDDIRGARRHGIVISCNNFDNESKTRLINCVGIGSPHGFQNTRGIYISSGSPKLYNCIGYGGGMGERSHGIICHRYSKPALFNCVGYGSPYTVDDSNGECCGIRFQSMTQAECHNCVGYAGKSDGSSGISVWHKSQPKLINCTGYGGKGKESVGLDIADQANPLVLGGYYGVANNAMAVTFVKNDGNRMKFVLSADADCVVKHCVTWLTTANMTQANVPEGTTFSLLKADGTKIIDKSAVDYLMSAISYPEVVEVIVGAGEELTMLWNDANGNEIAVADDTLKLQIQYQYAAEGGHGLRLLRNSKGVMRDVTIESNVEGDGVVFDTVNNTSEIDRCTIIGNNGVAINSKRAVLENVAITNSAIKGGTNNIGSFKNVALINNSSNYTLNA